MMHRTNTRGSARFSWILAIVVAAWIVVAALISLVSLQTATYASWADGNRLALASNFVLGMAEDLHSQGKSMQQIAKAIVADVESHPGISASVIDESGHLLAGQPITPEPVTIRPFAIAAPIGMVHYHDVIYHGVTAHNVKTELGPMPPLAAAGPPLEDQRAELDHPPLPFTGRLAAVLRVPGGTIFLSVTGSSLKGVERNYAIAMALVLLLAVLTTWLVQRGAIGNVMRPVTSVESALRGLSRGEYSRLEVVAADDQSAGGIVAAYNAAAGQVASAIRGRAETESNMRQFVAEAGHELRTPLTVIMGYVDVLRQGAIAEAALAQRILESIIAEGQRMSGLITKLLLLARLDTVDTSIPEIVDAGELAKEVVDSFRPIANGSNIAARIVPETYVRASRTELRESVSNLLDNAIKYAPKAPIQVEVRHEDGDVVISVRDTGPGMSPEIRDRAFERFSRGDERGDVPGSGLGLAIVKRAAERAGGSVKLEAEPGDGVIVSMRLPSVRPESD